MGVGTSGHDTEDAEAVSTLGTAEEGERGDRFYGYVSVGIFLYIAVFVLRTDCHFVGWRRFLPESGTRDSHGEAIVEQRVRSDSEAG